MRISITLTDGHSVTDARRTLIDYGFTISQEGPGRRLIVEAEEHVIEGVFSCKIEPDKRPSLNVGAAWPWVKSAGVLS